MALFRHNYNKMNDAARAIPICIGWLKDKQAHWSKKVLAVILILGGVAMYVLYFILICTFALIGGLLGGGFLGNLPKSK